jgi:hypothetical protein
MIVLPAEEPPIERQEILVALLDDLVELATISKTTTYTFPFYINRLPKPLMRILVI